MARIFISYKRVDKDNVFEIKEQIESALGEKCWIDLDGIESDAQFKNVIIRAINECEVVLFMYSKAHSEIVDFERDWTVRELNFASRKHKRIVFVNIDGSTLTDAFEFDYGAKQQVDGTSQKALGKLVTDLAKWLSIDLEKVKAETAPEKDYACINVRANEDCVAYRFGKEIATLEKDCWVEMHFHVGRHEVLFKTYDGSFVRRVIIIPDLDYSDFIKIEFTQETIPVQEQEEITEEEQEEIVEDEPQVKEYVAYLEHYRNVIIAVVAALLVLAGIIWFTSVTKEGVESDPQDAIVQKGSSNNVQDELSGHSSPAASSASVTGNEATPASQEGDASKAGGGQKEKQSTATSKGAYTSVTSKADDKKLFEIVEQMPSFPGGNSALMSYLSTHINYPEVAEEHGIQGKVVCKFVVERDGSITDVKVIRTVDPSLDKEAVRVIKSMPKWIPGTQDNYPVRVIFTLPITFRLQ